MLQEKRKVGLCDGAVILLDQTTHLDLYQGIIYPQFQPDVNADFPLLFLVFISLYAPSTLIPLSCGIFHATSSDSFSRYEVT